MKRNLLNIPKLSLIFWKDSSKLSHTKKVSNLKWARQEQEFGRIKQNYNSMILSLVCFEDILNSHST